MMNKQALCACALAFTLVPPAHAINAKYAKQLKRSGCTQVTEQQGCDIHKSKAENAKAGFGTEAAAVSKSESAGQTPYAGQWVAKSTEGKTVATIRIDQKERVWVSGKRVNAKRSDGGLVFKDGKTTYTIQGDRRLKGEDTWTDFKTGAKGSIVPE